MEINQWLGAIVYLGYFYPAGPFVHLLLIFYGWLSRLLNL